MSQKLHDAVTAHARRGGDLVRHALCAYLGLPAPEPVPRGPPASTGVGHLLVSASLAGLKTYQDAHAPTKTLDAIASDLLGRVVSGEPLPFAAHPPRLAAHDGALLVRAPADALYDLQLRRHEGGRVTSLREVYARVIDEALIRMGVLNCVEDAAGGAVLARDQVVQLLRGDRLNLTQLCWRSTRGRARYPYLRHQMVRRGLWEAWIQGRVDYVTEHGRMVFSAASPGTAPRRELEQTKRAEADIYAIPYAPAG